ncbi:hypothetical protein BH10BAC5_BH10BAC5_12510 [soil metagenome]
MKTNQEISKFTMFKLKLNLNEKSIKVLLTMFMVLSITYPLFAQNGNGIYIGYTRPPLGKLSASDLWHVTITNSGEAFTAYLYGSMLNNIDGEMIATGQTMTFEVKRGTTNFKVSDLSKVPDISYLAKDPKYKQSFLNTGGAPPGDYKICIELRTQGNEVKAEDCIDQKVTGGDAPQLISPRDEEELSIANPVFTWMYMQAPGSNQTYSLKIVELRGEESPENAMLKNKAFFEKEGISAQLFQYPNSAPKFEKGKKYAWSVKIADSFSEVFTFSTFLNNNLSTENNDGIPVLKLRMVFSKEKKLWEAQLEKDELDKLINKKQGNYKISSEIYNKLNLTSLDKFYQSNKSLTDSTDIKAFNNYVSVSESKKLDGKELYPVLVSNEGKLECILSDINGKNNFDRFQSVDSVLVIAIPIEGNIVFVNSIYGNEFSNMSKNPIFPRSSTSISWRHLYDILEGKDKFQELAYPRPKEMARAWLDINFNKNVDAGGYLYRNSQIWNYSFDFFEENPLIEIMTNADNTNSISHFSYPIMRFAWKLTEESDAYNLGMFTGKPLKIQIVKDQNRHYPLPYYDYQTGVIVYPPPYNPFAYNTIWEINHNYSPNSSGYISRVISFLEFYNHYGNNNNYDWTGTYYCRMIVGDNLSFFEYQNSNWKYPISNTFEFSIYGYEF